MHYLLVTLRISSTSLARLATSLSLLGSAQVANGDSCGIATQDNNFFSIVIVQGATIVRQKLCELGKVNETWNFYMQAFA
jgi:hypothetical protein